MSAVMSRAVYSYELPWEVSPQDKKRFNDILNRVTMVCLILALIIPFLPLPVKEKPIEEIDEKRLVKVLIEKKLPPPPPPKVQQPVQQKKIVKPQPVQKKLVKQQPPKAVKPKAAPKVPQKSAKEVAAGSGLLAFKDDLADLREHSSDKTLGQKALNRSGGDAKQVERSLVTKNVGKGSGGINTAALSRDVSGTGLGSREASRVSGPSGLGGGGAAAGTGGNGRVAQRDLEKIQITFDRNKSALFSMYNRALRSDASLQGKVVLNLTIAPSGKVTKINMVSSDLGDSKLEKKLMQRVKLINFGAEDVPPFNFNYPIEFYPV